MESEIFTLDDDDDAHTGQHGDDQHPLLKSEGASTTGAIGSTTSNGMSDPFMEDEEAQPFEEAEDDFVFGV